MIPTETLHSFTHIHHKTMDQTKISTTGICRSCELRSKENFESKKNEGENKNFYCQATTTIHILLLTSAPSSRLHDNGDADWNALRMMCDQAICYQTLILYHIKKNGFWCVQLAQRIPMGFYRWFAFGIFSGIRDPVVWLLCHLICLVSLVSLVSCHRRLYSGCYVLTV